MTGILVDSNVILDVVEDDHKWAEWSLAQLEEWSQNGPLLINGIIYAEISVGFSRIEELEEIVADGGFEMTEIPREALFLAGKVFLQYRRQKGNKSSPLPDFFIGAHAAVAGLPLLTRDARRYKSYFPRVELLCP